MPLILCVAGARPNFMKVGPILRAIRSMPELRASMVHTGQHYDDRLSQVFFEELEIPPPDVNLGIGSGPRDEQIRAIQAAFAPVVRSSRPDLVLVVGDVNSTIACASVARECGVRVAHVEAGLRSFDEGMIEERNRIETDRISDFLFVTERSGMDNLQREGVSGRVFFVGNVMIDSLLQSRPHIEKSDIGRKLSITGKRYTVATFHRPSNVDRKETLEKLIATLKTLSRRMNVVFPMHPRTRHSLTEHGLLGALESTPGVVTCEPLGYFDFINLVTHSVAVVTDSGGIQEETTFLGVPCITMRENTERPVTVDVGTNVLVGSSTEQVLEVFSKIENGAFKKGRVPDLWDGHAAERIVEILRRELDAANARS